MVINKKTLFVKKLIYQFKQTDLSHEQAILF